MSPAAKDAELKEPGEPTAAAASTAPKDDSLIPRERLIAQAREFTGYEPYEVAGALHGVDGDGFNPAQVKQLVAEWLEKPEEVA